MRRRSCALGLLLAAAVLAGCATDSNRRFPVGEEKAVGRTSFSFDREGESFDLFPEYHIAPGDVLDVLFQIRTWLEKEDFTLAVDHTLSVKFVHAPELNQQQRIRPDGTVSLPYLGVYRVIGKTVEELTRELKAHYSGILKDPELYVLVPEFRSSIKELKADLHTAPRGLSRLVTVRPDGFVTFPMVGDIFVADRSIPDVSRELNALYEEILPGLHCDLFLERHSGSRIYVLGEVREPGFYEIVKPISIVQALTMAGSHTPGARLDSVMVVRRHEQKLIVTRVDVAGNLDFTTKSAFFYLRPDDIIFVPRTWIVQAAEVARSIGDILFLRGWSLGFTWELHDARDR